MLNVMIILNSMQIATLRMAYAKKSRGGRAISFIPAAAGSTGGIPILEQIILIRHGGPALKSIGRFSRDEAVEYYQSYDRVGVEPLSIMPEEVVQGKSIHIISSPFAPGASYLSVDIRRGAQSGSGQCIP